MVKFYKKWKKYNEIKLTKNKINGLKYSKNDKSSTLPRNEIRQRNRRRRQEERLQRGKKQSWHEKKKSRRPITS